MLCIIIIIIIINTDVTPIHNHSLFSKIHSLKSEHIHSFLFRE